ncbi:hypothetical protein O9929_16010 [Vibrio lentus]|nr:hypothetical protein [Vibrio lentus]
MSSIIDDFRQRDINVAQSEQDQRLVRVLLDQLAGAESGITSYLPTDNKYLAPILAAIEETTDDISLRLGERKYTIN